MIIIIITRKKRSVTFGCFFVLKLYGVRQKKRKRINLGSDAITHELLSAVGYPSTHRDCINKCRTKTTTLGCLKQVDAAAGKYRRSQTHQKLALNTRNAWAVFGWWEFFIFLFRDSVNCFGIDKKEGLEFVKKKKIGFCKKILVDSMHLCTFVWNNFGTAQDYNRIFLTIGGQLSKPSLTLHLEVDSDYCVF